MAKREATLIVRNLDDEEKHYPLNKKSQLTLGSSIFANVTLKGSNISRKHVKIYFYNAYFIAEGVGKNSIEVNGNIHKIAKLNDGDVIRLGVYKLLFCHIQEQKNEADLRSTPAIPEKEQKAVARQIKLHLEHVELVIFERVKTEVEIFYSNNKSQIVREDFEWQIEPPGMIIINEDNELLPMRMGSCRVGVRQGDLFDIIDVEIRDSELEDMTIILPEEPFFDGETLTLEVVGHFSGGKMRDRPITHLVEWSTDKVHLLKFDKDSIGTVQAKSHGHAMIKASYGNSNFVEKKIEIQSAVLKSLQLRLENITLEAGTKTPFYVDGVFSNGRRQNYSENVVWNIEGDHCIKIKNNMIEAFEPGRCKVKALTSSLESNELSITVGLSSIRQGTLFFPDEITPGSKMCLILRVRSADGNTYDVTSLAHLKIDNPLVIRLLKGQVLEAVTEGYATVNASFLDQEFIKKIRVTSSFNAEFSGGDQFVDLVVKTLENDLLVGQSPTVVAVALKNDGSQFEVPVEEMTLKSLTPEILQQRENSIIAVSEGEGQFRAVWKNRVVDCLLNVVPSCIVKINFHPPELKILENQNVTLRANGLYSNGREVDISAHCVWKFPKELMGDAEKGIIHSKQKGHYKVICHFENIKKVMPVYVLSEENTQVKDTPHLYGDLRISDVLGQGGMGKVFLAKRISDNKPFAVKAMRERFLKNDTARNNFISEAQMLQRFNHPNIVKVYRCGWKNTQPYMVMEHLKGMTLAEIIKAKGPLSVDKAVAVIRDVSRALHVLHSGADKVIHQDIKPGNIFLTEEGQVKLMDFGITMEQNGQKSSLLISGMGTANYMSPEQGKKRPNIDTRSDIYSLGATFFVLLSGRPPFNGSTNLEIVLKHVNEIPKKLHEILDNVPPEVGDLVAKMLRKNPVKRPQTASEVTMALELFCNDDVDLRDCFL